jgi:Transposase IS116/IS110/IS902 family
MIDALHAVRVPGNEEEAIRDLVRAREDIRGDLMRARYRLAKLLLRHDVRYDATGDNWTVRHRAWLTNVQLAQPGAQATLTDYLGAIDAPVLRRDMLEQTISQLLPTSPLADTVARLRCLRGIDTLSAVGLAAEIGDFTRFARPAQLMSYLGLVPSEYSSGQTRRQGAITKTGSRHARRLLVEAAWRYRGHPAWAPCCSAARTGSPQSRSRSPGKPNDDCAPDLAPPGSPTRQTPHDRRGRRRQTPRRLLLGDHQQQPTTLNHPPPNARLRRRRNPPGHPAREHPRSYYEQPPRRSRSILDLDSELSRRNPVLRYPTREYQSDRASRTRQARRPLNRAQPHKRRPTAPLSLHQPPYQ